MIKWMDVEWVRWVGNISLFAGYVKEYFTCMCIHMNVNGYFLVVLYIRARGMVWEKLKGWEELELEF